MTLVEARGLRLERSGRLVVESDLSVDGGESLAVLGPSGCGKTSLLSMIAGLTAPSGGYVEIGGDRVTGPAGIGVVLQGYGLVSLLTAAENVEVGLRVAGHDPRTARQAALDELATVGLHEHVDHLADALSGGQQQRVAVARALVLTPAVVVADEPTAEQDADSRDIVLNRLFEVPQRDGALILATHDPKVAELCDHVLTLAAAN
jgi:putative ABC transport system ATP-binding protein